jgi:hypothetical protein
MVLAFDDPWAGYARLVVTIAAPGAGAIVVRPAPQGETGMWPWPEPATVHVLTAWNPGPIRLETEENRCRQARLERELALVAASGGTRWQGPALGRDPTAGERDEGIAVAGLPEDKVLELAARYGQDAVFAWSTEAWTIVACDGTRRLALGWAAGPA